MNKNVVFNGNDNGKGVMAAAAPQSRREDGGVVVDEECLKFILPFSFLISNLCTTLLVSYLDCRLIPHLLSSIIAMCFCELYYSTSLT